jgi:hypothetical protein
LIGGLVLGGKELVEKVRQSTKADAAEQPGWKKSNWLTAYSKSPRHGES